MEWRSRFDALHVAAGNALRLQIPTSPTADWWRVPEPTLLRGCSMLRPAICLPVVARETSSPLGSACSTSPENHGVALRQGRPWTPKDYTASHNRYTFEHSQIEAMAGCHAAIIGVHAVIGFCRRLFCAPAISLRLAAVAVVWHLMAVLSWKVLATFLRITIPEHFIGVQPKLQQRRLKFSYTRLPVIASHGSSFSLQQVAVKEVQRRNADPRPQDLVDAQ